MGEDSRYERGYRQLVDFMASAFAGHWEDAANEAGKTILEEFGRPPGAGIVVECDGVEVASCSFDQAAGLKTVGNVKPGDYRLRLDTGRLLWVGHLASQDLLWAEAHPGRDLPMAADTRESSRQYSRWLRVRYIDSVDWPTKCAMAAVLLARCQEFLPPELRQCPPEQVAEEVYDLLELHAATSNRLGHIPASFAWPSRTCCVTPHH